MGGGVGVAGVSVAGVSVAGVSVASVSVEVGCFVSSELLPKFFYFFKTGT